LGRLVGLPFGVDILITVRRSKPARSRRCKSATVKD
jgi:hypothetical protein